MPGWGHVPRSSMIRWLVGWLVGWLVVWLNVCCVGGFEGRAQDNKVKSFSSVYPFMCVRGGGRNEDEVCV